MQTEDRAGYFRSLLAPEQQEFLARVQKSLEVPCPHPTQEKLEEANRAECS